MNPLFESLQLPTITQHTPLTTEQERVRDLKDLVWSKIPNHLTKRPLNPTYARLVSDFDWEYSWLLLGPTGNGKSTAVAYLIQRLLREAKTDDLAFQRAKSIFWTRADMLTSAGRDESDLASHKILHRAEHAKLLVLDDLADASKTVYRVIQARYDKPKPHPIIVTSGELNPESFARRVGGEAIPRWIIECGGVRKGVVLGVTKK